MERDRGDGPCGGHQNGGGDRQNVLSRVFCCVSSPYRGGKDSGSDKAALLASSTVPAGFSDILTESVVLSKDGGGRCRAWGLLSGSGLDLAEGSSAGRVVVDAFDGDSVVTSISGWRETHCWHVGRPTEREAVLESRHRSSRPDPERIVFRRNVNYRTIFEARIARHWRGPNEEMCNCVTSIGFECLVWGGVEWLHDRLQGGKWGRWRSSVRRPSRREHWAV